MSKIAGHQLEPPGGAGTAQNPCHADNKQLKNTTLWRLSAPLSSEQITQASSPEHRGEAVTKCRHWRIGSNQQQRHVGSRFVTTAQTDNMEPKRSAAIVLAHELDRRRYPHH